MTSPRVEKQRQVVCTNTQAVKPKTASSTTAPLLSFKSAQNNTGLSIEHNSKSNQGYVKSYVRVKSKDGKTYNFNATLEKRINNVTAKLQKAEKENGLIGKAWSWTKNTIGFGDSSNKVKGIQAKERKLLAQFNSNEKTRANVFKQLTGCEYNEENLEKFIKGQIKLKSEIAIQKYKEGQEIAVDITSDIVSGVAAYGAAAACIAGGIAAAPFTAGASLGAVAVGVGIAAGAGAVTKVAIKGGEALVGAKKYSLKQAGKDATIGAVSGALAPVTLGVGGAIAKSLGKGVAATSLRFVAEGGTFGFADGATRSALEGNSIGDVALDGLKGAGIGAGFGFILGHSINIINNIPKTQLAKNFPLSFKNKINGLLDKISYKPSVKKLRKCATSVEDFGDHEKLFIKYHPADPIIFNDNQGLDEIKNILIKHNLLSDSNIAMFTNAKLAFNTIPELKGRSIKAYLGHGGFSFAFLLDNNVVLKITKNDIIDSKVLSRNIRSAFDNTLEAPTRQIGIIDDKTYSIQEFGIPTTNKIAFRKLSNDLRQRGVTKFDIDWDTRQCARFKDARPTLWGRINPFGTLKVVDLGCIHPPETL